MMGEAGCQWLSVPGIKTKEANVDQCVYIKVKYTLTVCKPICMVGDWLSLVASGCR